MDETQPFEIDDERPSQPNVDVIAEADRIIEHQLLYMRDEAIIPVDDDQQQLAEQDNSQRTDLNETQPFDCEQTQPFTIDKQVEQDSDDDEEIQNTQPFVVDHHEEDETMLTENSIKGNDNEDDDDDHQQPSALQIDHRSSSSNAIDRDDDDDEPIRRRQKPIEKASDDDDEEEDEDLAAKDDSPRKRRRLVMSSDDEDDDDDDVEKEENVVRSNKSAGSNASDDDDQKRSDDGDREQDDKSEVGELIADIFGDESDSEKGSNDDEEHAAASSVHHEQLQSTDVGDDDNEVRMLGVAGVRSHHEHQPDFEWDFDVMLRKKKEENRKQRRRAHDGSIDLLSDADDQIKVLIEAMKNAAKDDRHSNLERKPALQKRKMLPFVKTQLRKADLAEALVDNGIMSAVSEWLAPLPDKGLPALEIRTEMLKILQQFNRLEQSVLRQSGLGKAVMLLYKHPRETKENKALAARLVGEWARPIFQLDNDYRSLSREERLQRDLDHLPAAKRKRLSTDARRTTGDADDDETPSRPGDKGWIGRARVPQPSTRDYVIRPAHLVDGQFRGESGGKKHTRYDRKLNEMKQRTRRGKELHAVSVSIAGRNMTY